MSSKARGSHQKVESEEENNGPISVKVELVEHPEEIPIKEEPIKRNEKDTKSPEKTFPFDLCDKYLGTKKLFLFTKSFMQKLQNINVKLLIAPWTLLTEKVCYRT